ncbi:hypothetical protein QJS66_10815 [Kocuria rhizophila]|nr:hypothetical protein QJS66_10815 [Kocuria rhizophila]
MRVNLSCEILGAARCDGASALQPCTWWAPNRRPAAHDPRRAHVHPDVPRTPDQQAAGRPVPDRSTVRAPWPWNRRRTPPTSSTMWTSRPPAATAARGARTASSRCGPTTRIRRQLRLRQGLFALGLVRGRCSPRSVWGRCCCSCRCACPGSRASRPGALPRCMSRISFGVHGPAARGGADRGHCVVRTETYLASGAAGHAHRPVPSLAEPDANSVLGCPPWAGSASWPWTIQV